MQKFKKYFPFLVLILMFLTPLTAQKVADLPRKTKINESLECKYVTYNRFGQQKYLHSRSKHENPTYNGF